MQQMPYSLGTLEIFSPASDLLLSHINYMDSHKKLIHTQCFFQVSFTQRLLSLGFNPITLLSEGICSLVGMLQAPSHCRTFGE